MFASLCAKHWDCALVRGFCRRYAANSNLQFRRARLSDKSEVLRMRQNVYRGLDYLPDYYDFFLTDKHRTCIVEEVGGKLISFGVLYFIDDGKSMLSQAGRVHVDYERQGNFKRLSEYCNNLARERGCVRRVALVETTLNKYARSERFRKTHTELTSKLHYAGILTQDVRKILRNQYTPQGLSRATTHELETFFCDSRLRQYLFPTNHLLLDYVPLRCDLENIQLLKGRNTEFFSSVYGSGNDVKGLLSAGSSYKCENPKQSYTIDIFGNDEVTLKRHLLFHMNRALKLTNEDICLQIFVNKGHIAQELCRVLLKLGVEKCNWYVESGITIKTIVEEDLKPRNEPSRRKTNKVVSGQV